MDCNNFFVSCERLFRPDLRGKPVAVLSSNDGCFVARSQEVKDIGIPMGVPLFQVRDLVKRHRITLFSSNFPLYRDISARVMHALSEEFDSLSVYSVDEAFFDIENKTSEEIRAIRSRIMQKTGIPVSFGIGPTKTIAKLANAEAKKGDGVVWCREDEVCHRYGASSCGIIWGVGRQLSKRLSELGVHTVAELISSGLPFMRAEFGVHGERLFLELTGIPTEGTDSDISPHASIMSTRSFKKESIDRSVLLSALGHHVVHIGEKLRERKLSGHRITIMCTPNRHGAYVLRGGVRSIVLTRPTHDTTELLKHAQALFSDLYEPGVPYKKAGVVVSELVPDTYVSGDLFTPETQRENSGVYDIIDRLNERFGRGTVRPALVEGVDAWAPSAELRSAEYTTRWDEIARVKAM